MKDFLARFVAAVVVFGGAAFLIFAAVLAVVSVFVWLLGPLTATVVVFGLLLMFIFAGIAMGEDQ